MNTSKKYEYDLAVFIGRFQPLHDGHLQVIRFARQSARRQIILVGSAYEPRTLLNPFFATERVQMLRAALGDDPNLLMLPLEDSTYNPNEWLERTRQVVMQAWEQFRQQDPTLPPVPRVAIFGHDKDATSYYLRRFPDWATEIVPSDTVLSATTLRTFLYFPPGLAARILESAVAREKPLTTLQYMQAYVQEARQSAREVLNSADFAPAIIPTAVRDFLLAHVDSPAYDIVAMEAGHAAKTAYEWRHSPHTPQFITADALVVQSGHVLMIKRKGFPGQGLWAMPGGFAEPNETLEASALRELDEETALRVPPGLLHGRVRPGKVFDDPRRSSRGRTVTHVFMIPLDPGPLPKTKTGGKDDEEVANVQWVPLAQLRRDQCFEDHYAIIKNLTAGL